MRWSILAIFAYLFTVLQTSLFVPGVLGLRLFNAPIRPDLLLVAALCVALVAEPHEVFIAAWCLGLLEDLTISHEGPLGVTAILFGVLAWLVCLFREAFPAERPLVHILLAFGMVLLVRLPQQLLLFWLTDSRAGFGYAIEQSLGDAAYSALLAPAVVWVLVHTATRRGTLRTAGRSR